MDASSNLFRYRKGLITFGAFLTLVIVIIFIIFHHNQKTGIDPGFSKYIESYTTGEVSKETTIRIRLAGEVQTTHTQNEALSDNVFDFSPSIKGKAYWIDARTIEFRPDKKLDPDKSYEGSFNLKKILTVPAEFENFKFNFQTIKPDFTVSFNGLQTATNTSADKMKLTGVIQTADTENPAAIEKLISVDFASPAHVIWEHMALLKRTFLP